MHTNKHTFVGITFNSELRITRYRSGRLECNNVEGKQGTQFRIEMKRTLAMIGFLSPDFLPDCMFIGRSLEFSFFVLRFLVALYTFLTAQQSFVALHFKFIPTTTSFFYIVA